ncbi:MAG: hypothetical protein K0S06_3803 [Microvirga sp.]|nr:hypothetical protein [Microvirga sp.]
MPAAPALIEWLTVALVLITGLYCFFTFKIVEKNSAMVEQMRAQYEAFIAPSIVVNMIIKYQVFICLTWRGDLSANGTGL